MVEHPARGRDADLRAVAAARSLLLAYLPGTEPVWLGGQTHGERRVDAFLVPDALADRTYWVLSIAIDGAWVPDVVSEYPHIPFATALANAKPPRSEEIGVFVSVETIHSPRATRARFRHRGGEREVPVVAGHGVLFAWDTPWLAPRDQPKPLALLIGDAWTPTVSSLVAATPGDFRRGYLAYWAAWDDDPREHDWAPEAFYEHGSLAEKVAMVECILDGDVPERAFGCLAAGPVENLIGHDLLDYVTGSAERRARWVPLLRGTYWHNEPPAVQERMRALLGGGEESHRTEPPRVHR